MDKDGAPKSRSATEKSLLPPSLAERSMAERSMAERSLTSLHSSASCGNFVTPLQSLRAQPSSSPPIPRPPAPTGTPHVCCADLYNAAARHYAWMKHAKEEQKTNWRVWLYLILEEPSTSRAAMVFAVVSALMILLQVLTIMMESGSFGVLESMCGDKPNCTTEDFWAFKIADYSLSGLFTIELVLRSICANSLKELRTSVFWWIDFFGVAPFYLQLILDEALSSVPEGLGAVRSLLRLLRILRILKVLRQHPDSEILYRALQMSARPLVVPFTFLVIGTPPRRRHAAATPPPRRRHAALRPS